GGAPAALSARVGGTAFQQVVWQALLAVPYGQHCSYQALAVAVGKPQAAQAVGNAVGANPLAGIIPCHRVLPPFRKIPHYRKFQCYTIAHYLRVSNSTEHLYDLLPELSALLATKPDLDLAR